MLAAKLVLLREINLNWDEFYFLTHVHSLARGELPFGLQTAYARSCSAGFPASVATRSRSSAGAGRDVAAAGGRRGAVVPAGGAGSEPSAAALAVLSFLASWTTLRRGAAFRADSMLLPLNSPRCSR